ncbi:MAG: hypothetical protein VB075_04190 [Petrimonas sp.]|jgi:hypothetical protein|uniref:hypothetical protein n=1 Tax=Petrimonas sp. TaxID=2023866 RepID=UPI000E9799E5|nr:hypothetical protein [Petrimonas sp.]HBC39037.1 hypothetical protein [Porphyromonadaceae bacterium]MEA5043769.1 hypothetical protein [Petrimonas sp.]HBG79399.1 hypothetical protein [Porphyromonadaceae bacterium]HBK94765.1 hypothetical protein [Porphyromonadaceae bacterium]
MNNERIHTLLENYWNCETSVSEERELQEFFNFGDVPDDLLPYIPVFAYKQNHQPMELSGDFEKKLNTLIRKTDRQKQYITIKIFEPFLRIAASVIMIAGIGVSVYFFARQNNRVFAETYNDPGVAMQQATSALNKLSTALQATEEASLKSLEQLDNLDLDWSEIDSLSAEIPLYDPDLSKNIKPESL